MFFTSIVLLAPFSFELSGLMLRFPIRPCEISPPELEAKLQLPRMIQGKVSDGQGLRLEIFPTAHSCAELGI